MNKYERFALDYHLSEYPQDLSYSEVLGIIQSLDDLYSDDRFTVWSLVENLDGPSLSDLIENLKDSVFYTFSKETHEIPYS